jgi:WD40 repeat protein
MVLAGLVVLAGGLHGRPPAADVIAVFKGHEDAVESIAISPNGAFVATASFDRSVRIFDLATGAGIRTFGGEPGHKGPVLAVAFDAKGDQLASGGADNSVRIWDVSTRFPRARFAAASAVAGPPLGLHFTGEFLPERDRALRRLKLAPQAPIKNLAHPNLVDCLAFDDTGNLLATGCHDGVLRIWDVPKAAAVKSINAHVQTTPQNAQHPIYSIVWTPDYKQILTASFDRTVKLWDVASGNLVREFKAAPGPAPIESKKEEKKEAPKVDSKAAAEFLGGLVRGDPPLPPGPPGHRDQVFTMALTKNGKYLATGSSDRTVKLWEVATGRVVREFASPDLKPILPGEAAPSHPGWVQCVRLTPDDRFLVSAGPAPRGKSYLAVWRLADGKRVYGAEREFGPIQSLAITADGAKLVLGCAAVRGKPGADAAVVRLPGK